MWLSWENIYNAKIPDITLKYRTSRKNIFTTSDYNKCTSEIFDTKIKQKELVKKSNINNLVKISDLNAKLTTLATKAELKAEQDKIVELQTDDLSCFLGKNLFGDRCFQNIFVYQPTLNTLELKDNKGTNYVIGWKSKGVYTSKFIPLCTASFHSIKVSGCKIVIKVSTCIVAME